MFDFKITPTGNCTLIRLYLSNTFLFYVEFIMRIGLYKIC